MTRFSRKALHPLEHVEFVLLANPTLSNLQANHALAFLSNLDFSRLEVDLQWKLSRFAATRWAIKESIYKAVHQPVRFNQIRIWKHEKKPRVDWESHMECMVSVSHDDDIVVASAIVFLP
jgi:phosphopantetheinyl transferase (holo-ACP synthase)